MRGAGAEIRIRHSNFIERTFGETRRRTKVIGRMRDHLAHRYGIVTVTRLGLSAR